MTRLIIPDAPARDVLCLMMQSNYLTRTTLAAQTGIPLRTICAVLRGTRELTLKEIDILAKRFHLRPEAFLPRGRAMPRPRSDKDGNYPAMTYAQWSLERKLKTAARKRKKRKATS